MQKKINDKYIELINDKHKISYNRWMNNQNTEAYSSHQPVIVHLLNTIKEGKVLEFGVGYHSTPIFHIFCMLQDRKLLSVETNQKWLDKFVHYDCEDHEVRLIRVENLLNSEILKEHYSIAFIDGFPAEIRQPFLEKVDADYLIVHDTEGVVQKKVTPYKYNFSKFKHIYHFKTTPPMTTVLSNLDKINEKILTIF